MVDIDESDFIIVDMEHYQLWMKGFVISIRRLLLIPGTFDIYQNILRYVY